MPYQMLEDGKGIAADPDGRPLWIEEEGKPPVAVDFPGLRTRVKQTLDEIETVWKPKVTATELAMAEALAPFKDIKDPAKALEALHLADKLDKKQLIDTGKLDEVRAQMEAGYTQQLGTVKSEYEAKLTQKAIELEQEAVGNAFGRSKYIQSGAITYAAPHMLALYGPRFKRSDADGSVVAIENGTVLSSRKTERAGLPMDIDEALEYFVMKDPFKDSILAGKEATGAGVKKSGATGKNVKTRAEFDALPSDEARGKFLKEGGKLADAA
jgi:hypothetical protein